MHRWFLFFFLALSSWAHAVAPPTGPATVLVIPTYFATGQPANFPPADLAARYADARTAIENYSYGTATLDVTIAAPVQTASFRGFFTAQGFQNGKEPLATQAETALAASGQGLDPADFDIVSYFFPQAFFGSFAGIAQADTGRQWINGTNVQAHVIAHETCHNYGMGHASSWVTNDNTIFSPAGTWTEYGDPSGIMGGNASFLFPNNHPNPVLARKPGWVAPAKIADATNGGDFRLYRFNHKNAPAAPGPLALRITPEGGEAYTIAYRYIPGVDGAMLIWEFAGFRSRLLDCTPGSAAGMTDATLPVGTSATDPTGTLRIRILSAGGSGTQQFLKVSVEKVEPGGVSVPPTVPTFARAPFAPEDPVPAWIWHGDNDGATAASGGNGLLRVVGERGLATGGNEVITGEAILTPHPFSNFETYATNAGAPINAIYSNGSTLFAGLDGKIARTSRPFGWTVATLPLDVQAITSAGPVVIAAGDNGILRSANGGATWSAPGFIPATGTLRGLTRSSGGLFVAVGDAGAVLFSTDGIAWNVAATVPSGANLYAVAYGNGTYVAVGDNYTILTSTDANTWVRRYLLPGPASLRAVVYASGENRWFASGIGTGIGTSTDATTWQPVHLPPDPTIEFRALATAGGAVFAGGDGYTACAPARQGTAWSVLSSLDLTAASFHGGRLFVGTLGGDVLASNPLHTSPVSYNRWALTHLATNTSRTADPDADGLINFQEYTNATHPGIATSFYDPPTGLWENSLYHFPRPHLTTALQSSSDLTTWSPETPTAMGDALGFPFAPATGRTFYRWEDSEP